MFDPLQPSLEERFRQWQWDRDYDEVMVILDNCRRMLAEQDVTSIEFARRHAEEWR